MLEGTWYGVISGRRWHTFVARAGGPRSGIVKFSQAFDCDDPDYLLRSLYLYMLHLANNEPRVDPGLQSATPNDSEWLHKGWATL